jgi:cobalt-zinc-cadmium efflux system membrane fusion protein
VAGVVTQRQVSFGQNITSVATGASTPVYSIADLGKVWLVANVRETDAPSMRVGDTVEVHVVAFPGRVFKATLIYVAAALDPTSHRLPVKAEIENKDGALKPEMFAQFDIITGPDRSAPGVPETAVVYEGDTAHVWVVTPDKSIGLKKVQIGRINAGMVEILSGLSADETIVSAGSLFIDRAAEAD